jgi:hypothetical protein
MLIARHKSIILVPDYSNKSAKSSLETTWSHLSSVLAVDDNVTRALVLGFEYGDDNKSFESIWNYLSLQGDTLLECIMEQLDRERVCGSSLHQIAPVPLKLSYSWLGAHSSSSAMRLVD